MVFFLNWVFACGQQGACWNKELMILILWLRYDSWMSSVGWLLTTKMDSMMILELKVRWGYFLGLISFASCICYNLYHTTAEVNLKLLYLRPLVIGSPLPTELSDEDILSDFFLEFGRFSLSIGNSDYSLLRYSLSSRPFDPATSNPCLAFSSSFSILFLYLCAGIK